MAIRPFTDNELMEISKILGDTSTGFTGSEMGALLVSCAFPDPGQITKRDRMFLGLQAGQGSDGCGATVAKLIERAMDPVRYRGTRSLFEDRRHDLNVILAFAGMQIREDGKLEPVPAAATLSEAERRLASSGPSWRAAALQVTFSGFVGRNFSKATISTPSLRQPRALRRRSAIERG